MAQSLPEPQNFGIAIFLALVPLCDSGFYLLFRLPAQKGTSTCVCVFGGGFNSTASAIFHGKNEILASVLAAAVLFPSSVELGFRPISF